MDSFILHGFHGYKRFWTSLQCMVSMVEGPCFFLLIRVQPRFLWAWTLFVDFGIVHNSDGFERLVYRTAVLIKWISVEFMILVVFYVLL